MFPDLAVEAIDLEPKWSATVNNRNGLGRYGIQKFSVVGILHNTLENISIRTVTKVLTPLMPALEKIIGDVTLGRWLEHTYYPASSTGTSISCLQRLFVFPPT